MVACHMMGQMMLFGICFNCSTLLCIGVVSGERSTIELTCVSDTTREGGKVMLWLERL
jgi:hypothetical protein